MTKTSPPASIGLTHEALYRAFAKLEGGGRILRSEREIRLVARQSNASRRAQ